MSLFWHLCHLNPVGLVLHGVSPQPLVVETLAGGQPRGRPPPQQPRDEVLGGRGHMVELGQVETVLAPGYYGKIQTFSVYLLLLTDYPETLE